MRLTDALAPRDAASRRAAYGQALRAINLQQTKKEAQSIISEGQIAGLFAPRLARLLGLGAEAAPPLC